MDPVTIGVIAAPIVGSLLGSLMGAGDKREAERILSQAAAEFNIPLPVLKDLAAKELGSENWDLIPNDFGNKGFRDEAIRSLAEVGQEGGFDAQSRLANEQARRAGALQEAQGRASVNQEAQRRGIGGPALVYGQLAAQQAGADRASMGSMQAASDARSRALDALATSGGMAADAERSDFDKASKIAASRDAITRFNIELGMDTAKYNNALQQQQFGNRMNLAQQRYGVAQDRANIKAGQAAQTRQMWGGAGQGVGMGLGAYAQDKKYQDWLKTQGKG